MKTLQARGIVAVLIAMVMLAMVPVSTTAAPPDENPVPVQEFYVPFPEEELLAGLRAIVEGGPGSTPNNPMTTYISLAVSSNNTVIYYDHWENGYDADISNPTNIYSAANLGGTQIWGDADPSNGAPPGIPGDVLNAGTVVVLHNTLDTNTIQSVIDFDGRDKVAATKTIAVSRTGWATGPGTLLAGSVEVYDTSNWGTEYLVPIGENITGSASIFEYTGISVMAGVGGATISVDANADGDFNDANDLNNVTLAEGQSRLINGGINVGARVISDRPVQVDVLTGDRGSSYESRDSALLPTNMWTNSYYTPVSTIDSAGTKVWLYNPSNTPLTVQYRHRSGGSIASSNLTVPAKGYLSQTIPNGSGAQFYAPSGAPFYAFSTTDVTGAASQNQSWDWGYSLVPEDSLTPQVLIGLGIGRDPTSSTQPNENGNPVWVTPVGNGNTAVTVYVDYDADPSTGALIDPNGNRYDAAYNLRELERQRIYNPTGDQTGMLVYVLADGVKLAAAWGQDPSAASAGAPGLDVGTGVPPLPLFDAGKNATLDTDVDGDGYISPGDVIKYTVTTNNISRAPVSDLRLFDEMPTDVIYVPGSTYFTNSSGVTINIPDDSSGTAFPLDGDGHILDPVYALPVGGHYTVTFKATIKPFESLTPGIIEIVNAGKASTVFTKVPFVDRTPLFGKLGDFVWEDTNMNGIQDSGELGIPGVLVKLLDSSGTEIATQLTDANGGYLFKGLRGGSYTVEFVRPTGFVFSPALQGPDRTVDSNADPITGKAPVTLGAGETNRTIDAGMWRPDPKIVVTKTANPTSVPATGGNVQFTVKVQNTGTVPVILTKVVDSVFGEIPVSLFDKTYLAVGDVATYTFTEWLESEDLVPHNNVVKATAVYGDREVEDEDDATVKFTDVLPEIAIVKTANPTSIPETGGNVTFTFTIKNPGTQRVTVTSLVDSVFGNLLPEALAANAGDPIVLGAGEDFTFTIERTLSSPDLTPHKNVVTVKAEDKGKREVTDEDDADVTFTDVLPEIAIVKTANPTAVPETGGNVTFTFTIKNPGIEKVTVTSLVDDVFGNLLPEAVSQNGGNTVVLNPGASYTFTITRELSSPDLTTHHNVVTVTGEDNEGNKVEDEDDATVEFEDVLPEISITKSAMPGVVKQTGGDVTFTFTIENPSTERVTVTSLEDSVFGDLLPEAVSQNGGNAIALDPGASYTFSITRTLTSEDLAPHHNVVTVTGEDNEGNKVEDDDDATVEFDEVRPQIEVTKSASPGVLPETGGYANFTIVVKNTGTEPITLTSIVDSVFGVLDVKNFDKTYLEPGESAVLEFKEWLSSPDMIPHNNVVTVTGKDENGTEVEDDDDADVIFTDVLPKIAITKTASVKSLEEPGGNVTFTFVIKNDGPEDLTVTSLVDNVFGDLLTEAEAANGGKPIALAPEGSFTFAITRHLDSGDLKPHVNRIDVVGEDNEGNKTEAYDDETVTFIDALPSIKVEKTVDRREAVEPGGVFNYTVVVTNNGKETVTLTRVVDDKFGVIYEGSSIVLEPGASRTFTFQMDHEKAGKYPNTVFATAKDDDGNEITVNDNEEVVVRRVGISVVKTSNAPQGGVERGSLVTYTYVVTNTGDVTLYNVEAVDDKLGVVGEVASLAPGQSVTFQATTRLSDTTTNVVVATGKDDKGNKARDEDKVTVETFMPYTPSTDPTPTPKPSDPYLPYTGGALATILFAAAVSVLIGVLLRKRAAA